MASTQTIASGWLASNMAAVHSETTASLSFLASALGHVKASTSNATTLLSPSPKDLLLALPRMVARAGSYALGTVPDRVDSFLGLRHSGSIIAEATGGGTQNMHPAALSDIGSAYRTAAATAAETGAAEGPSGGTLSHALSFQQIRNFGGVFTYMTSKWALACFTLVLRTPPLSGVPAYFSKPLLTLNRPLSLIEPRYMPLHAVIST